MGLTTAGETKVAAFPGSFVKLSQFLHGTKPLDLKPVSVTSSPGVKYLEFSSHLLFQPFQFRKISAGDGEVAISNPSRIK